MTTLLTAVLLGLIVAGIILGAVLHAQWMAGSRDAARAVGDVTFYQAAALAGGARQVAITALCYLVWTGMVEVREGSKSLALVRPPAPNIPLAGVEQAILGVIPFDGRPAAGVVGIATVAAAVVEEEIPELLVPPSVRSRLAAVVIGPALLAGLVACGVWISNAASRSSLGLIPVVPVVAAVVILVSIIGGSRRTPAGNEMLRLLRDWYSDDLTVAAAGVTSLPIEQGIYLVALYGRAAMTGGLGAVRRITTA